MALKWHGDNGTGATLTTAAETRMPDTFRATVNCIDRLLAAYRTNPRLIVAVDYDDTVFDFHQRGQSHDEVISLLHRCKALDFYVVLFTASAPERHESMRAYLLEQGIELDAINENPIPLPYGNHGKIFYNLLLDDRAGLGQSMYILSTVLQEIEKERGLYGNI